MADSLPWVKIHASLFNVLHSIFGFTQLIYWKYRQYFPSSCRQGSHLTNTLFTIHRNPAGKNNDARSWLPVFRLCSIRIYILLLSMRRKQKSERCWCGEPVSHSPPHIIVLSKIFCKLITEMWAVAFLLIGVHGDCRCLIRNCQPLR